MKKILTSLVILFVFISCNVFAQNHVSGSFNYSGANWQKYNGHRMEIVVLDTSVGGTKLIAEQIIKDGKFKVSGSIAAPQNAFFGLYNPNGDFVYKQEFIVEPGKLEIDRDSVSDNIIVTGGKYNPIFMAINEAPEYLAKVKAFNDYSASLKKEDFKKDAVKKKFNELRKAPYQFIFEKNDDIRFHNPDPYARLLAIYHSNRSIKYDDELNELEKELGPLPEIVYLRYSLKAAEERNKNRVAIKVGSVIKDFNSKDINGKAFHLADALKENKYTLVEFWASWCGPCRAEIPNMKKAYQKFHKKGFEIVSFTLDHEGDKWKKASREEKLPWINVGDLLAYKSPVVKMFGINGIPANYLVDQKGTIIAKELRGANLDKKLAEVLDK